MTPDIPEIAKSLTEAQRECVQSLSDERQAGPRLPDSILPALADLREAGLVEREFGDTDKPTFTASQAGFRVHMSACWWFRLTPTGLAVRAYLENSDELIAQIADNLRNGNTESQQWT